MDSKPPVEERIWAVVSHLSVIAMGMGLLLPVIGWSESRRKSNYASFQSLQALGYQSLGYTVWILTTFVILIVVGIGDVAAITNITNAQNLEREFMTLVFTHMLLMFGLIGVYFLLPVIAAIACAFGKDFRYPLMGNRLAKYLGYDLAASSNEETWMIEEHEERWVASMGHFSVIIMLWGMLSPVTAWILQGKRSAFLKFQSIQAFVFQAGTFLLYVVSMFLYFAGAFFFIVSIGGMEAANQEPSFGFGLLVLSGALLCVFVVVLFIPLLHIMGQWAGYRILKGDDYRYPLVGKWVEKWLAKKNVVDDEQASAE